MTSQLSNGVLRMKKENLTWTSHMDNLFVEAMIHQDREGNRKNGTFTSKAYSNMVAELCEKLPSMGIKKPHLKNRLKTLKENFNKCYDMFKSRMSGFAWNPVTKMWNAKPEVWEKLIAAKPDAAIWMSKTIDNYEQLEVLFAKDRPTGEGAETAKEKKRRWAKATSMSEDNMEAVGGVDYLFSQNEVLLSLPGDLDDGGNVISSKLSPQAPSQSGTTFSKGKKKNKKVENDDREVEKLKSALDNVAEAIREGNTILERSRPRVYSEAEICSQLEDLGVDPQLFDDAYLFLSKNPDTARAVFGYPLERRLNFLEKLMYPSRVP